jgi:hypothetical protein
MKMSNVKIRIEKGYSGPTLEELGSLANEGPIDVRWLGSARELSAITSLTVQQITLVVEDIPAYERASTSLGLKYTFPPTMLDNCRNLISSRTSGHEWRKFAGIQGPQVVRGVMTESSVSGLLKGFKPALGSMLSKCWLEGLNIVDIDVLMDML